MKKFSRIIAILLIVLLIGSLAVSCKKAPDEDDNEVMTDDDGGSGGAREPESRKAGKVRLQSPAVLHQDGLRGGGQLVEAQALENRLVLRLGEHLERRTGMVAHDARHQRDQESFTAHFRGYSQAFEDITGNAGTCHNGASGILHDIIRIKRFHSEPVGLEEPLYLITEERRAQWHLHYVLSNLVCIHPAASFPILPVPPAMELTSAKLLNKNRFPKK